MKVGRNDPCPCGSGKKYKHCCLRADEEKRTSGREQAERLLLEQTGLETRAELDAAMRRYQLYCDNLRDRAPLPSFMEFIGHSNTATAQHRLLRNDLEGRHLRSRGDMESYLEHRMQAQNDVPVEEFEGITPAQMHRLLASSLDDCRDIVMLAMDLPDEIALSSPLIATMQWILRYLADHGGDIRLTARGNFPRAMCARFLQQHSSYWDTDDSVPTERTIPVLATAHDLAIAVGCMDESQTKTWITTEGVTVLTSGCWARMFRDAITVTIDGFDWQDWLHEKHAHSHFDLIQQTAVFSLLLLRNHSEGTEGEFFARFARAFPTFLEPVGEDPELVGFMRRTFRTLFFSEFCVPFGLVQVDYQSPGYSEAEGPRYKTTELFRAAFRWRR